ncbi:MAG: TonB-dependent receptor [Burkholderiaceae bacterium]|nr:TonB-dependent receptor [Burkholderiaceae bacterium]
MTASASRTPALTPRALVSAISLCFIGAPALAQNVVQALAPVVITGARFASAPELAPIGATVITADEIRRAGVSDVNQAIRKIGGVYGRQSFTGSSDFDLDLRGFGTNSSQNMVVVVDGVRVSESEMGSIILSGIAIDTVERIEITRGGSSVLYGDGATGGVINIVTRDPARRGGRGSVFGEVGQFGLREGRAAVAQAWDSVALDAAVGGQHIDNYRANNAFKQVNFNGGAQWNTGAGRLGLRVESLRQDGRLPGSLTGAQFNADPRQTVTPDDFGSLDSDRVTAFVEQRVGAFDLAAELSHREKSVKSLTVFYGTPSSWQADTRQTQFSPRLRHLGKFDGVLNEAVAGIDLIDWTRATTYTNDKQKSKALYLRDELKFDGARNVRLVAGARHELFDKTAAGTANKQSQNAWEVQGSVDVQPRAQLYAKAGQSYRVANADENGYTASGLPLKGQSSHDLELGVTFGDSARSLTLRGFRHNLVNEIFFDPTVGAFGANANLDPTRRQGIELDASAAIGADWRVSGHAQHVKATFTEGPNAGREMGLVPRNIVTARLSWLPAGGQSADIGAQWVDRQRNGNDFSNSCAALMPAFATVDARYGRKYGAWEVALSGLNLTDKHYRNYQYGCQSGIYPANGRQLKLSARYDF